MIQGNSGSMTGAACAKLKDTVVGTYDWCVLTLTSNLPGPRSSMQQLAARVYGHKVTVVGVSPPTGKCWFHDVGRGRVFAVDELLVPDTQYLGSYQSAVGSAELGKASIPPAHTVLGMLPPGCLLDTGDMGMKVPVFGADDAVVPAGSGKSWLLSFVTGAVTATDDTTAVESYEGTKLTQIVVGQ